MSPETLDAMLAAGVTAEVLAAAWKAEIADQAERAARQIPWLKLRAMAFERDGEKCGYCGCVDGPFDIDHIIPRAAGGENVLDNVMVSCSSCNRAKRDRGEEEWSGLRAKRLKDRERKRRQRSRDAGVTFADGADSHAESVDGAEVQGKGSLEVSPPAPPLPKPSKSPPFSSPKILTEEKRKAIASCLRLAFAPPPGVSDEQWAAFCGQRRKKLNDRSYLLLTNKLAKLVEAGWPAGELIDRAVESGWETVFAPKTSANGDPAKRYVSASGYEYRGDAEAIQREAQRRGDNDTYWQVEADRKRRAVPIGNVVQAIVDRAA